MNMSTSTQNLLARNQSVPQLFELQPTAAYTNSRGETLTAQSLPERAELTRLGNSWVIRTAAVACVTAVPTTTAPASIWNGEPAGGKSYVIDNIGWVCTTSNAAATMFGLLACLNVLPLASQPASTDTLAISSLNGRKYSGKAGMSHTVTVVDDNWVALGNAGNTNALTATVGYTLWVPIEGLIIVPPGYLLNLAVIAQSTTAFGKFMVQYHEVQLPVVTN
jgi:hypothetical protein